MFVGLLVEGEELDIKVPPKMRKHLYDRTVEILAAFYQFFSTWHVTQPHTLHVSFYDSNKTSLFSSFQALSNLDLQDGMIKTRQIM